jgi:AAA family ATP:ADP antiporter
MEYGAMVKKFKNWLTRFSKNHLQIDRHDKIKLICLAMSFFFIIGSYSILRSLKASVFLGLVGKEYLPLAKIMGIVLMVPAMIGYSKLIDTLKRYQVVYFFLLLYAVLGIAFAITLTHPVYGLHNTQTSPYRILGWAFEIFMDLYQALVVSTFWSYTNSISTPLFANKTYGLIVAISRIGGICTPLFGYILISESHLPSTQTIPLLVIISSIFLGCAAFFIHKLIKLVPYEHLQGYYSTHQHKDHKTKAPGVFEGLKLMLTQPYVFGIFGLVACFEMISIIFDYKMQVLMSIEHNNDIKGMIKFMFMYTGTFQVLSFIFALLGTTTLLSYIGVRSCLFIMPIATLILTGFLAYHPTLKMVFILMVLLRALHYGFNSPIREVLYIPTIKDIQFKSKAWIESFGRTFSKSSGSTVNILAVVQKSWFGSSIEVMAAFFLVAIWLVIAAFIGKKYNETIAQDKLIGQDDSQQNTQV